MKVLIINVNNFNAIDPCHIDIMQYQYCYNNESYNF